MSRLHAAIRRRSAIFLLGIMVSNGLLEAVQVLGLPTTLDQVSIRLSQLAQWVSPRSEDDQQATGFRVHVLEDQTTAVCGLTPAQRHEQLASVPTPKSNSVASCCAPITAVPAPKVASAGCCAQRPGSLGAKSCACASRESGCTMGDRCRCGQGPRGGEAVAGLFFQLPGCHPPTQNGPLDGALVPFSMRLVFLVPDAEVELPTLKTHASVVTDTVELSEGYLQTLPRPPQARVQLPIVLPYPQA